MIVNPPGSLKYWVLVDDKNQAAALFSEALNSSVTGKLDEGLQAGHFHEVNADDVIAGTRISDEVGDVFVQYGPHQGAHGFIALRALRDPSDKERRQISERPAGAVYRTPIVRLPFGLHSGETLDEVSAAIGKENLRSIGDSTYTTRKPPNPHASFVDYGLIISPALGLVKIMAVSDSIKVNDFGDQLKKSFTNTAESLSGVYGKPDLDDSVKRGSLWTEDRYWMMGLLKGERTLAAYWSSVDPSGSTTTIGLLAHAQSESEGWIELIYEFENFHRYIQDKKSRESAAF